MAEGGHLRKRSFQLAGHRTSVALEPEFWTVLETVAARRVTSLAGLVTEIKKVLAAEAKPTTPFLIVGRSGGAIPTRYATADPELAKRHLGTITLCGAMRGSVGAALLHANGWAA